jgi:hypothetical protein
MIKINNNLKPSDLKTKLERFWQLSGEKVKLIGDEYDHSKGSPVFTVDGKYSTRGWPEWTQGFEYGSAIYSLMLQENLLFWTLVKSRLLIRWQLM